MKRALFTTAAVAAFAIISGCNDQGAPLTGYACMGKDNDTLVERLADQCKAGDTVATKYPAYFCDFKHAVAYNDYNSALCVYTGKQAPERIPAEEPAS
ncbi:hypothetical protein [Stutzerimonas stutzeri]|uniref:hypothetical protein n=2 Tax=Stutzerimonas stutzeri TaxID=316 RepID=UPI001E6D07C7|nr:hypothetical protein [Stutzerimonas stutzeri]CAD0188277.1 Hypothetical_protein [Stutzerimonas stutzeri]